VGVSDVAVDADPLANASQASKWTCQVPVFSPHIVADQLRDGYWLEAPHFTGVGKPDLIGYGLAMGEI
jgi:hypothetical protein